MGGDPAEGLFQIAVSIGIALVVFRAVKGSLEKVLDEVVRMPAATAFFSRVLLVVMLAVAFSSALISQGTAMNLRQISEIAGQDSVFAEYGFPVAVSIASSLWLLSGVIIIYLVLVTVLVVALRRRSEQ